MCLAEPHASGSWLDALVRRAASLLRPFVRGLGGRRSPATHDERPIDAAILVDALAESGYATDVDFLVHPPFVYRLLPPSLAARIAGWLNDGGPRIGDGADIAVVRARKAGAGDET
jgi:hypothetical protein